MRVTVKISVTLQLSVIVRALAQDPRDPARDSLLCFAANPGVT